jgi:alcohol dehydrogenase (cytochrome c)
MDPETGKIKWHFQYTPHDVHDWDSTQIPILFEGNVDGRGRKLVAMANRNGYYYLLDRQTGQFLTAVPFVKQTWSDGIDKNGRPFARASAKPTVEGTLVWPGSDGGANWFSPTYSPRTGFFYQAAAEMSSYLFKRDGEYKDGTPYKGGGERVRNGDDAYGAVRALEATTGKLKWEFKLLSPPRAGLLSTAGGLIFGGAEEGNFFALDAATGKALWQLQLGAPIRTNPISFTIDGRQQVATVAGSSLSVLGLP